MPISPKLLLDFSRANLIHKCFTSRDAATLWRAFGVYVRPLLEYTTCVWSPNRVGQVNRVNLYNFTNKFTNRLPGKNDSLVFKSRLMRLRADSVELRRLRLGHYLYLQGCLWSHKSHPLLWYKRSCLQTFPSR